MSEFHNQGPIPLTSIAYVKREFEERVFSELLQGRWVLLLGPRQHGKSTSLFRLKARLQDQGLTVAYVDLEGLPPLSSFEKLLRSVSEQISRSLGSSLNSCPTDTSREDLFSWLDNCLPDAPTIVLIIDEAANIIDDDYRNSFYGQIRQIANMRAEASSSDLSSRIRFVFAGSFRPESLVSEYNSPFNVCTVLHTDDLSNAKAKELVDAVNPRFSHLVESVYAIVGGQPYLLQTAFLEFNQYSAMTPDDALPEVLGNLPMVVSRHLEGIFSRIIADVALTSKISNMVERDSIPLLPADADCVFLQVLGIAKRNGARLEFRNELYSRVARSSPQLVGQSPLTPTANRVWLYQLKISDLDHMCNHNLQAITISAYNGGIIAHNAGHYRLSLVAFGAALEAVLLDLLKACSATALSTAVSGAKSDRDHTKRPTFGGREDETDPTTWRLVNMINVARQLVRGPNPPEPSHRLREWRNLIHPAVALRSFIDEAMFEPDSIAASSMFMIIIRDTKLTP